MVFVIINIFDLIDRQEWPLGSCFSWMSEISSCSSLLISCTDAVVIFFVSTIHDKVHVLMVSEMLLLFLKNWYSK